MTFDEWFQSKQGEPYGSMYPFARDAYEAGKLEAAQHILNLFEQRPWAFYRDLKSYVEELKCK